jgi:hypothetical protein
MFRERVPRVGHTCFLGKRAFLVNETKGKHQPSPAAVVLVAKKQSRISVGEQNGGHYN